VYPNALPEAAPETIVHRLVPAALDSTIGAGNAGPAAVERSTDRQREARVITKFDSLFAGHIDMDNVGYAGAAVNERRFSNDELVTVFDKAQAIAKLMDRVGYDTFWMAEHHFQHEGYECIPNVLMTAVHLAHLTRRLRFGCGFNITPMWHPLRLAEDFATADVLTGGRVTFGVGRGYHTREVETFGAPLLDQPANRALFEEQVEIILKALHQESFSHHGLHYSLPPSVPYRGYELKELTLVPRPLRQPVECWQPIQGGTGRAVGGGSAEGGAMHRVVMAWQEAHARLGRHLELGEGLCFGFHFYIANSREQGIREAGKYYEENLKMFGPLRLVRALTDEQIAAMADPTRAPHAGLPRIADAIQAGGVLCGSPDEIIEHLKKLEERYPGLERVMVSLSVGVPQAVVVEQLERFAADVMPAFQGVPEAALPD
jgi:alkanesulfonate monooxygenase SsuD/methylene tetrahydromethanopterin reductase-like flavin-dependent oxidoreductase (luciferase family)